MIRKYMKTMMVKQKTESRREVVCDGCGAVIQNYLYQVTTHHDRWGNDSIESYETKHFCCRNCMNIFLDTYWEDEELTNQAEIEYMYVLNAGASTNDYVQEIDEDIILSECGGFQMKHYYLFETCEEIDRCGKCPCFEAHSPMYCLLGKNVKIEAPYGKKADNCPLKELPQCGRLVNADKFDLKYINFRKNNEGKEYVTLDMPSIVELGR